MLRSCLAALAITAMIALTGAGASAGPADGPDKFPTGTFNASKQKDWSIKFTAKGKYTVMRNEKVVVKGTYEVEGKEITFTDEGGDDANKDDENKSGKYRWTYDSENSKLKFKLVEDNAKGRAAILTGNDWVMQE